MFAYCGNNPILYADDTGKFPWAVLAGAVLGALTAVVGGAISGDSISTIVGTALVQAVIGAVIAAVPELAPVFLGYDIYDLILEGIYSGMSINETSIHIAALLFSFLTFPETNDPLVDTAVAATFGVSKDTTIGAIDNAICFAREYRHPAAVTYVIISTLAAGAMGGGCIGAVRKFFGFGGEKDLWQRI